MTNIRQSNFRTEAVTETKKYIYNGKSLTIRRQNRHKAHIFYTKTPKQQVKVQLTESINTSNHTSNTNTFNKDTSHKRKVYI